MDLQTLSTLDDLLSDVLLDGIHLWFQTHKMSKDYRPLGIPPGKILDIIQRKVIFERKLPEAVKDLLDHARRYLSIYLPSAGFEISQTDRYSAVTNKSEACVIANRPFEVGDELQYCAGTIANLTEQEEKDLETKTSDFSVIKTSRRGTCLFLGPARFVNHDCDPNCSFMSAGASAIYFKVQKPISINDEITTHYGDNYFGVDNQECLCATCDRLGQGGYKDKKPVAQEEVDEEISEPEQEDAGRRLRNRRGKPINYYPTLMKKGPRKVKESSVRPSTPLPPVESDTIPSINTSPAPTTNSDSDTVVNPPSEQGIVLGECGSISVSPTNTPPLHTSTINSGSEQPASSALAIEAPDHPLQAISRTIDTLSLDDNSPFVESSSSTSSSSLKGVTPLTNNLHTAHNSPSVATETSKSSIMDGLPLPDTRLMVDNSSDSTSLTPNPLAVDTGEAVQTIQPALEISESLPMDPIEVDFRSDQGEDPMLIGMMTSLELFEMRDAKGAKLEDVDGLSRATVGSDAVDPEEDDPAFSDQFDGDLSDAGIDEETPFSPKNFRMSFEFLLSDTTAHASSEESGDHLDPRVACRSDTANESSRQASVQLSEGGEAVRTSQKRIHKRAKPITEILDPNHCATCKTYIPQHERNDTNDCRRCYRHFAIYGTAWPSRSRNVIAERYKKAAQEERDREKKRKLAAEAKARQEQVKEEARAKQEKAKLEKAKQELAKKQAKAVALAELELKKQQAQQKIDMRKGMGLSAVEKTKVDRHKQRRMKLSVMPGDPYDGYLDQVDRSTQPFRYEGMTPSMANADMVCVNGQVIYPQYPHMTYQGISQSTYQGSPHSTYQGTTSNAPGPYQQGYYYPIQQGYPPEGMIPPTMPPHPFHSAPYIVFVDPMDDSDEFWWPAVTVPLHQWDPATMPDYSQDEDHVLVRFLEDCTYANCSIAGLMLFHKDLEPYTSYVKRGREFAKNGAMKRALALFEDDIMPPRFRWKNMSWENQKDLAEVLSEIHHSRRMREANIHMKLQRLQAELHQSTHNLQLMRNDPSNDPFHIQARELELEREYHFKVDQLRHKIQDVGGSLDYFNKNSAMMRQVGPTFIRNNSMDIPHLQVQQTQQFQQHPLPATKAKRSRKPKPSNQPDDSQQSMELTPTWQSMEPTPSKPPKEPKEPVDPSNAKPKKARGPSKRKIQIDLQLEEHRQLISAASMGLTSFKTANGTVFALASPSQIEDSVAQPTFATSKKKRAVCKSRAPGDDGPDQVTLDLGEGSTDQPISNNATATSTAAPKARKRRADRQTVDVTFLDAPVALPIMTLPRSISLEPSGHQLVVMDPSSRFSSLPALLKTNGSRGSLSPNWTIHDHEYRVTEQRLIGGHYNCFEITLQPERAGFVQKSQDGDMFLFDSNDISEASTPSSSDSTETDLSLHHGGTPEPTEIWSKRSMARKDGRRYTDEDEDEVARYITEGDAYVDGEGNDNMDARSTADTFGTGELSSMAPSSSSSSLGEGDRDVDVDGYETQDVDIEGLTDQDQEAVMCLLELTKLSAPALQRAPPMGVWEVKTTVPHYDRTNTQETSYTIATPKRAPKKKRTKKSRQPSATPNATTSSLSSPSSAPATTESTPEQAPSSEASQAQSRRGKKQAGKPRKASSAKSKVVVRGVKRPNPGTDADGNLSLDRVTGDEERASGDKERITGHTRKLETQEKATPTQPQRSKKRSLKETEILQNGATQVDGSAVLTAGPATVVNRFAATPSSSSLWLSSSPWTGLPMPFSSSSGSDVTDNKELQALMQWSIKGDLVEFDLDSSVRSVRSRTRKSESPVVVSAMDLAQPKGTKDGSASKPRVANKIVNEPKRKPQKRRKLTSEEEKTQTRSGTESTAPSTTKSEEVVGDSISTVGGEPEEQEVVARKKASKDAESPTPEPEEGEEPSDDAATTVELGSTGKDTQGDKLTLLATADDKATSDDPGPLVDNVIDQSRISSGKVTVLRKAPAVVVVSFTLLSQDNPDKSDIPEVDAKTQGGRVTTEAPGRFTMGSKTVPSSSGEMLGKRGRKRKVPVELPDDPALQRPVAMSTRKRIRQDTTDIELALEEELVMTRSTASKAKGRATDVLATALGAKLVKRRRVGRSSKSKENEISPTQEDEAPSDEDETLSRQDETASAEDESSSEEENDNEEEASSEKGETSTDSEEDSDMPVGPPVRRQSLRLGRADIAEQSALSRRDSRSSAKSKASRKKNQTKEDGDKEDLPLTFGVSFAITTYNIAEGGRLRIRDKEVKEPNTSTPKFEVGDSVIAPGEDNLMFDGVIKDRRDHKTLPEVYEYKIHYDGYASKYDAWIEERMLKGE
ncbi:Histone-lysine N-methyltransferase set9 [Mortierella sp. AD032]|nr:Histone-lysine N-methyltransferase set9 [Mortierella sp. AD032]